MRLTGYPIVAAIGFKPVRNTDGSNLIVFSTLKLWGGTDFDGKDKKIAHRAH